MRYERDEEPLPEWWREIQKIKQETENIGHYVHALHDQSKAIKDDLERIRGSQHHSGNALGLLLYLIVGLLVVILWRAW